ncbi:signal recognition particle-docking protein FtsY [Candidatus Woesearchaeota archaeon]|nr:signal recognition particle-docking protein FtsY [Candidatus Woesearchaeota archaeon]
MFKFLKDKLKGVISKISKRVETEPQIEEKLKEENPKAEIKKTELKEQNAKEEKQEEAKKQGFFNKLKEKILTTNISEDKFNEVFSELELILLENNTAFEVIEKIKSDLKQKLTSEPISRAKIEETVRQSLKHSIKELFYVEQASLPEKIKQKKEKPFAIAFFGINGSGKTTTIAKIAHILKTKQISCVIAASDTFRAASIEQMQYHADKLGVKMIRHSYGSDPAAVAFDAIKHAKAKSIDVVLIDTAGRLHSNTNLMDELKKVVRVSKPDLKLFVGESIAGNDCIEQAKKFNDMIGIDAIILTKADVDEKGGTAISVSYVTKKPIMYLGIGQEYEDLKEFEPNIIVDGVGL